MTRSIERAHYRTTFVVLLLGVSSYALLQSLVTPVLRTIQLDLHTTQSTVTWVVTVYLLSASIFTPILGRVGDMVGKERMLVVTLLTLAVGSVLAGLAQSIGVLIVARAIQGVGAGVLPLAFGIIRDEFPPERVATGVGLVAAMTAVGGGAGIVLAGPIVGILDFHWLFWIPPVIVDRGRLRAPVRARIDVRPRAGSAGWPRCSSRAGSWPSSSPSARDSRGDGPRRRRRPDRGRHRPLRRLGPRRAAGQPAPDRHAHDAPAGGVDDQPRRPALRGSALLGNRLPARVPPDAALCRLRVRGQRHRLGPVPAADDRHHVHLRDAVGPRRGASDPR